MTMAQSLDYFLPSVTTQDTRKRLAIHEDLVGYLSESDASMQCDELDKFVDGLASWVSCSNYKVSLNGLEVLCLILDRLGEGFKPHVTSVLSHVVDRLGDSKDPVRESAQELLQKLMVPGSSPQYVFDRITGSFQHKLWRVREEMCICLQKTLNLYGAKSLTLSKIVPLLIKLLEDQSGPVRDAASDVLVETYRHVGERVRQDLAKRDVNSSKLNVLFSRMDEVKNSGTMVVNDRVADRVRLPHQRAIKQEPLLDSQVSIVGYNKLNHHG